MQLSIPLLRNGLLVLLGVSFLEGFLAGRTQAVFNLPSIWKVSKWAALARELDCIVPLFEQDKAELIEATEQERREVKPWTKNTKTTKAN